MGSVLDKFRHALEEVFFNCNTMIAAAFWRLADFTDFDIVREGETPPPSLTIRVCDSLACELAGAEQLKAALEEGLDPAEVRVLRAPCMGGCDVAPAIRAGDLEMGHATTAKIQAALDANQLDALAPNYKGLAAYRADGGYALWDKVRSGELSPDAIIETLSDSGLRGLGGAGFPTGPAAIRTARFSTANLTIFWPINA